MKRYIKINAQWFYSLPERVECGIVVFKERQEYKKVFDKSVRNFIPKFNKRVRDVVAFPKLTEGFLGVSIENGTKVLNKSFAYESKRTLLKNVYNGE